MDPAPAALGRVALAWSAAGGAVPHAEQLRALRAGLGAGGHDGEAGVIEVSEISAQGLGAALRAKGEPVRALVLLCHGRRGAQGGELLLRDAALTPDGLRELLRPHLHTLRLIVLAVCDSGDALGVGALIPGFAQALHRAGAEAVLASRTPLRFADALRLTEALWPAIARRATVEEATHQARQALRLGGDAMAWASLQLYAHAAVGHGHHPLNHRPYRGLLGYGAGDEGLYFGRERETGALEAAVRAARGGEGPRWIFVAGPSGSGKSSLVRAGLAPRLLADPVEAWTLTHIRPGDPVPEPPSTGRWLLFIDQLEELFTRLDDTAAREAVLAQVLAALQLAEGRGVAVSTLRSDHLERALELRTPDGQGFDEHLLKPGALLQLTPLGRQSLKAVVEGPAACVGLQLEEDLAGTLVEQVAGEPGALPLLGHALDTLWRRRRDQVLTFDDLEAVGGAAGALARSAEATLGALSPAQRAQARRLLVRMVSIDEGAPRTRRRVRLSALRSGVPESDRPLKQAVEALVEARLVVPGSVAGEATLELAHEALIERWVSLRRWLEEDKELRVQLDRLERWEAEHQRMGSPATLLNGPRLEAAKQLVEAHPIELSGALRRFILQSEWAAEARVRRRRYDALAAFFALLLVCVFAGVGAAGADSAAAIVDLGSELTVASLIGLACWTRWAMLVELAARFDFEALGLVVFQAFLAVMVATRGVHGELLSDRELPAIMAVGVFSLLTLVPRLLRSAGQAARSVNVGVTLAGGVWLAAFVAVLPADPRPITLAAVFGAAACVELLTWRRVLAAELPRPVEPEGLRQLIRDAHSFVFLAAFARLLFIYGSRDLDDAIWRETNLGLALCILALVLIINSVASVQGRGESAGELGRWHLGQALTALSVVVAGEGMARLMEYPLATSDVARWLTTSGLAAYLIGAELRRAPERRSLAMSAPAAAVAGAILLWTGAPAWLFGGEMQTWMWLSPLAIGAVVNVGLSLREFGLRDRDAPTHL